jgi:hypothetical protein
MQIDIIYKNYILKLKHILSFFNKIIIYIWISHFLILQFFLSFHFTILF